MGLFIILAILCRCGKFDKFIRQTTFLLLLFIGLLLGGLLEPEKEIKIVVSVLIVLMVIVYYIFSFLLGKGSKKNGQNPAITPSITF